MATVRFVHAFEDVAAVLSYAADLGMIVQLDTPTERPEQKFASGKDLGQIGRGVFFLYRPEWVFGAFEFVEIPSEIGRAHVSTPVTL